MHQTASIEMSGGKKEANRLRLRLSPDGRTITIYIAAFVSGFAAWSGKPSLNYLALLYPFIYLHSQRRLDASSSLIYYASATWSVIPGTMNFFNTKGNPTLPILIWLMLISLSSAPWIAFYHRRFLPSSAVAAIISLAIPPLSLVTVAHPLISAGQWFPGTRWLGLCFPMVLILLYRRLGMPFTIAILIGSSFLTHIRFHRPLADPHIVAVNTTFGGAAQQDQLGATLQAQEHEVQATALAHPNTLMVYPESVIPTWTPMNDLRWTSTFTRLKAQHTGVLIGTTIPIPYSHANRNVLLSRGFTERLSYVQRVPVPLGMWRISDGNLGFPLMLRYPATIRIWDHRAGVLICYEQLIVWPVLQTLSRHPDMLLAPSNLYWAQGTNIPPIEHVCAQDWADLWAIPLYEAINE